jgi:two-component system LytT family response regulator
MKNFVSLIIIDDEVQAIEMLESLLSRLKDVQVLKTFTQAKAALDFILENPERVDLILLDVSMPEMDGFEFLKALQKYPVNPCVIFVTGYEEFAIEALRAAAFDFLLKPVTLVDVERAIKRFRLKCVHEQLSAKSKLLFTRLNPACKLVFSHHRGIFAWHSDDIFYITADGNYSNLCLTSGEKQLVTMQIGKIEELTESCHFFRISRSTLINLKYFEFADQKERICQLTIDGRSVKFEITPKKIHEMHSRMLQSLLK